MRCKYFLSRLSFGGVKNLIHFLEMKKKRGEENLTEKLSMKNEKYFSLSALWGFI
jgi:hypothetical protein